MTGWGKAVLTYPPTWLAAIILGATVWLVLEVIDPPAFMVIVLVVLAVLAVVAWPFTMSATGTLAKLQFEVPRVEEVDPAEIAALRTELGTLADTQPTEQLDALLQKRASLINVLQRRLDAGELTYARYLATSQQVFSSALDNLREVAVASESISTIDETYIDRRLAELTADDSDPDAEARERATLERRRELRHTPAPPDRPVAGAERVRAHRARPHHHRARRRADRQEARGCRRGDGGTRSARRPDRRLCDLIRPDPT